MDLPSKQPFFRVLGVRVNAIQIPNAIAVIERWIEQRSIGNYVAVTGMHGVMEAQRSPSLKKDLNNASLVVPDGMPLVWLGRWHKFPMRRRVYGPELLEAFCHETKDRYRHFFYGGGTGVAAELAEVLRRRHGIRIAGCYTPPFRKLNQEEERELFELLKACSPDVLWVGLSTPKQELWMAENSGRAGIPVMVGVGAAFDFLTGRTRQAPIWMREHGLEWLFRLGVEPKRLWHRYLIYGPQFLWNVALELSRIKDFT